MNPKPEAQSNPAISIKQRRAGRQKTGVAEGRVRSKQMKQPTQPDEAQFHALFDHFPVGVAYVALDGHWLCANQRFSAILGYTFEELQQLTVQTITHPDDLEREAEQPRQVLAGALPSYTLEKRYRRKDGAFIWVKRTASLIRTPAGEPQYFLSVIENIEQQKQMEAENARLLQREQEARSQAEETARRLEALQRLTDAALVHLSLEDLLREVQARIHEVMRVDNSAILLLSEDGQYLTIRSVRGPEEAVAGEVRVPFGYGIAGRIAASRAPMVVDDLTKEEVSTYLLQEKMRSLLGVPLLIDHRVIGVLHVDTAVPHHFTAEDVQLLERVAERVTLAIEHARLYEAEAARASQLEAIFEAAPAMISLFDAQGTMTQINQKSRQVIGPQRGGEGISEFTDVYSLRTLAGERLEVEDLPLSHALRGETITGFEIRVDEPAGERFLSASAAPFYNVQGEIAGVVAISHDITPLRRAEREAAERARLLEVIFEGMGDGVSIYDAQGHRLQMNQAGRQLMGMDARSDFSDSSITERLERMRLRDARGQPFEADQTALARALRGEVEGSEQVEDTLITTLDGQERHISSTITPIRDEAGQVTRVVTVFRDVTERRRLEQRTHETLQALLDMAEALVELPAEAAPMSAETKVGSGGVARRLAGLTCRVLGCQRISISVIDPETDVIRPLTVVGLPPEEERQWWAEQPENARLSDSPDQALVEQLRAGKMRLIDMREPPYNLYPNPYHITTFMTLPLMIREQLVGLIALDHGGPEHHYTPQELALAEAVARLTALVIERERLLREREEARGNELALREANRQMSEFMGIASHELRTPLTSIKANIQLTQRRLKRFAADDGSAPAGADAHLVRELSPFVTLLERLDQQTGRLNRLVGDLLDISRIQVGKLEFDFDQADLAEIVRDAVAEQQLAWAGERIRLSLPADLRVPITVDRERIGQVVTNYLTNALKYSPPEAPVDVTLRLEGGQARVEVGDEGPGIPAEEHELVWERFHRVKGVEVQSGAGVGLGLGLYICKTIIERHAGTVGLESVPGEGALFWFTLPLAKPGE